MTYFFKKTIKRNYLQIYENFYDLEHMHIVHYSYKFLEYVHELTQKINDIIAFCKEYIDDFSYILKDVIEKKKTMKLGKKKLSLILTLHRNTFLRLTN